MLGFKFADIPEMKDGTVAFEKRRIGRVTKKTANQTIERKIEVIIFYILMCLNLFTTYTIKIKPRIEPIPTFIVVKIVTPETSGKTYAGVPEAFKFDSSPIKTVKYPIGGFAFIVSHKPLHALKTVGAGTNKYLKT